MNSKLAVDVVEILEPFARRLLERSERGNEAYRNRWALAIGQAALVVKAYDAPETGQQIAYHCAHCGAIVHAGVEVLDSGTTLTCDECGRDTIVDLKTPEAYSDAKSAAWQRYWQERGF